MVDGIVLAGGFSSRLGKNKMTVIYNGEPVIIHTIKTMKTVCNKVIVVTGHYHEEISHLIRDIDGVEVIYNLDYDKGMFSSILKGVGKVNLDFFIIPGDYPLVTVDVYKKMLKGQKLIRVPSYHHKLGHPIYFDKQYKEQLLETKCNNLKSFRNQYDFEIINVLNSGILFDVDTIQDVNKLKDRE